MEKIENYTVIETVVRHGRFFVKLDKKFSSKYEMPRANYNWLKNNPTFSYIPKGYVIHHLDNDPLNDDISNLALMQRHHHTAYHWKHKNIKTKLRLEDDPPVAYTEPLIRTQKNRKNYHLEYSTRKNGKCKRVALYSYNGEPFKTMGRAEEVKKILWR